MLPLGAGLWPAPIVTVARDGPPADPLESDAHHTTRIHGADLREQAARESACWPLPRQVRLRVLLGAFEASSPVPPSHDPEVGALLEPPVAEDHHFVEHIRLVWVETDLVLLPFDQLA